MGDLGRRNELLHVRFSYMADRLEDLKSLTEDFNLLTKPIEEMATELPKAKARILEVEALMSRELAENRTIKGELKDLRAKHTALLDERATAVKENKALRRAVEKNDADSYDSQNRIAELEKLLRNAERQTANASDARERLEGEIGLLTADAEQKNDTLHQLQLDLARHSDQSTSAQREVARLQKVVDDQVLQVVNLQGKANDWEKTAQERLQEATELKGKLEAEKAERQKAAHGHEIAISSLSAERSSLGLKVEALEARLQSAEQTVAQSREQIAEKDDVIRSLEESQRADAKSRAALERKTTTLESNLKDQLDQHGETQRLLAEAKKQGDMLSKALSAKSAALENAQDKAQSRADRLEELTKRFDQERMTLEIANRRLVEELENERAERTLAQGALKIARESRASLQRQNESLKRANRAMRNAAPLGESELTRADAVDEDFRPAGEDVSNVSVLEVGRRDGSDTDERRIDERRRPPQ